MSGFRARIVGCGSGLPKRVVTNAELAEKVDTSDEWITERTGIRARRIATPEETTGSLAIAAAQAAAAGWRGPDVDLIVLATATPDNTFPATAVRVQQALGCFGAPAFDVQAVCTGFVYALATADNFIRAGQAKRAVVIGAETFSRILDWSDRSTCVLFGDGAGAVALDAVPIGEEAGAAAASGAAGAAGAGVQGRGVLATRLHADGRHHDLLYVDGGPSSTGQVGHLRMNGREVFRHAVTNLVRSVHEIYELTGVTSDEVDWIVPHQANRRIIDATAQRLKIDPAKVVLTVDHHGNTSAASIPLALAEAVADGRIRPGHLVLLEAMGGGFTWGAALVRM